ncbi:hypothetical protein XENOCAPTIV_019096 [Xenoophorus captivus]|uniref:Fibulin C-terminal Ig-like domain-containing protein n=1 Tax=Xenoophorus captivus TaxID=1517983 RepID=A0ABV0RUP9_9TELE
MVTCSTESPNCAKVQNQQPEEDFAVCSLNVPLTSGEQQKGNGSAVLRCVKACQEHDSDCARDPVHIITSTALSLPTFQHLEEPEDLLPDEPDVFFDILATHELNSFDVIKRVIRQIKPVMGPKELVLEVTMKYVQSGVVSQQNLVLIHIFISKFWF